jgi:hypothetical protein
MVGDDFRSATVDRKQSKHQRSPDFDMRGAEQQPPASRPLDAYF